MKITKRQLRKIIREAIDPREMEEPLGGWVGDRLTNDPDYGSDEFVGGYDRPVDWKIGDLVRKVDYYGTGYGEDYKKSVGDQIGTVVEIDDSEDGPIQYLVHWPNGTPTMGSADEFEHVNESAIKVTKRQLRRIILEFWDQDVERFLIDNAAEYHQDPSLDAGSIRMLLMDDFMDHIGHSEDPAEYEELINQLAAGEIREEVEKAAPFGSGMERAELEPDQKEIVGHT